MYKFEQNDILKNTVIARPKYRFSFYSGSLYINNDTDSGIYETGSIRYRDLNLTPESDLITTTDLGVGYIKAKQENGNIVDLGAKVVTGSTVVPFTITREFIYESAGTYDTAYTSTDTVFKLLSLKNSINNKRSSAKIFDFDLYFNNDGLPSKNKDETTAGTADSKVSPKQSLNLITFPNTFYGDYVTPGTVTASFYRNGELVAKATDSNRDGRLIEQTNTTIGVGESAGFILYEEGTIVFTNTASLDPNPEHYIQPLVASGTPVLDTSKWIHFGSYLMIANSGSPITGSSYTLEFQGTHPKDVLTMFAHAPKNELNWSNNPTYLLQTGDNSKDQYVAITGSKTYVENSEIHVKNIVSSSFSTYSASFEPTTYIRTVGVYDEDRNLIAVAKVANPVKKTTEQDYTFKLKLDL
tara:strand:+ start:5064 stop:6299 length:1236 start_codon:yes stop_codon:yes gene_type:complete